MRTPNRPPPYVKTVVSRGKTYYYFDTGHDLRGKRLYKRLPDKSDVRFGAVYAAQLGIREKRQTVRELPTVAFAANAYQRSNKYRNRAASTQDTYLIYIRVLVDEMGNAPVSDVKRADIRLMLDKMMSRPGAANMLALVCRNVFAFAVEREWVAINPAAGITLFETGDETHEPWPEDLVALALTDPAVRLPVALLYYTAQRIGDVCKMRWSDVTDGYIEVRQQKTGKELDIRLHADLAAILAQTPREALTILYGPHKRPRQPQTLRMHLQAWATKQGYAVVPHGLRKNAVNALLEAGCSVGETSAISGQSLAMVERYAKRRNNRKMGSAAVLKWERNVS